MYYIMTINIREFPERVLLRIIDHMDEPSRKSFSQVSHSFDCLIQARPMCEIYSGENKLELNIEPLSFDDIQEHIRITDALKDLRLEIITYIKKYPRDKNLCKIDQYSTTYINYVYQHMKNVVDEKLIHKFKIDKIIYNNQQLETSYLYEPLKDENITHVCLMEKDMTSIIQTIYIHVVQLISDIELIFNDASLTFERGEGQLKDCKKSIIKTGQMFLRRMKSIIDQTVRKR